MKFSVVIPTYKRGHKLKDSLISIVNQNYSKNEYEIIVVEDGSHEALEVAKELKVIYLWQENKGPAAARNAGVQKAKGQIIAFTDDDCVPPPNWLQFLEDGYKRHPDVVGVGGYLESSNELLKTNIFAQYESYVSHRAYGGGQKEIKGGFEVPAGGTNNMSFLKKVVNEVGGFDTNFPTAAGEDADIKKRITDKGYQLLYIPLKVEHHQDYHLNGFLRQSFSRGIGSYYFQKKWDKAPSTITIIIQLILLVPKLLINLVVKRPKWFVLLDFLFVWQEYRGMLAGSNYVRK